MQLGFKTKMKIDVARLQHLMKGSHLGENNTHTRIWCSNNIDYRIEHIMHNVLTCTRNICNLNIAIGFNFVANMTVRSSLNRWDQSIIV